ncbi:hypothetical protein [Pengzhenrongella frigida]|uniref:Uncharacterized protein n=1 Tax=Pengzhenrongella frigida TaxID=1259133 RepID=A0A4Q5MV85_9MICO|nr:hypothetical protein [Cellulomonas sp. HLT2-17]RYV49502.1 hypothetical protein EUA98_18460 [Cellulomonas sp. HLT2-17]
MNRLLGLCAHRALVTATVVSVQVAEANLDRRSTVRSPRTPPTGHNPGPVPPGTPDHRGNPLA